MGRSAPLKTRSQLRPRVGAVLALVDPALGGQVDGVHDFRVAARSLRAGLRTLTLHPHRSLVRKTRRDLRTAIRVLADVRDRDVGRSLLAKLPATEATEATETALKRRILGLAESDHRVALTQSHARWPQKLDHRLIALLERGEPALPIIIRRTLAEAWRQRRRAIDIIESLGRRYDSARLHNLRIRIRRLRYALEVLAEVESGPHVRLALLKPLQSALGNAQDRIVLSRWLSRQAARFGRNDASLASALRLQARYFRAQAVQSHARFLKLRTRDVLERLALHVDATYAEKTTLNRKQPGRVNAPGPRSRPRQASSRSRA